MPTKYFIPQLNSIGVNDITNGICQNGEATFRPACDNGQTASGPGGCGQGISTDNKCVTGTAAGFMCKSGTSVY